MTNILRQMATTVILGWVAGHTYRSHRALHLTSKLLCNFYIIYKRGRGSRVECPCSIANAEGHKT